jgi:transcriptional regulator with GAF, ATPase, and Fis domain
MVTVNCGAIPRELVASELFGHRKGAFTGAVEARTGAFDEADGGTLFLDEIGELPIDLQPALLRVLETGEVRAVGAERPHTVRVRVIAATNRDLAQEVEAGRFREDLFYRLAVVRLRVPPLRERIEDIEPLAQLFARAVGLSSVPEPVVEALKARSYPGNARELRNAVQAYAALGVLPEPARKPGATLELALGELVDTSKPYADLKEDLTDRFTKLYLAALLQRTGGNQSAAARLAGLDRTHLGRLVAKYGPFGGGTS